MLWTAFVTVMTWLFVAALPSAGVAGQVEVKVGEPFYRLGVFPYIPPARLERLYGPIALEFTEALGRKVRFQTKPTFERWFKEVRAQTYDIVFIQPFYYVQAFDEFGYLPLARTSEPLSAVLMVLEESPLRNPRQLRGKTIALPPFDAAVSHLTKLFLVEFGLEPDRDVSVRHYKNHDSCLQAVLIGTADACGTARTLVRAFTAKQNIRLRELARTPSIPHVLYAVHSRIPEEVREALRKVILGWHLTPTGQRLLENAGLTPFVPAQDADYDIVREFAKRLNLFDKN